MTNIHFLEMIQQFDDIIQTHVLIQLQEETDMRATRSDKLPGDGNARQ